MRVNFKPCSKSTCCDFLPCVVVAASHLIFAAGCSHGRLLNLLSSLVFSSRSLSPPEHLYNITSYQRKSYEKEHVHVPSFARKSNNNSRYPRRYILEFDPHPSHMLILPTLRPP